jgi:allantoinase
LSADHAPHVIDASGRHVLPGLVDPHVHLFDPGWPDWEDFPHGTRAAAAGGITTILEMPNSQPCVDSAENLRGRLAAVRGRAVVDFALFGGLGETNPGKAAEQAEAGAVAFKTFRARGPAGSSDAQGGIRAANAGVMLEQFQGSAATGLPHAIHAEYDPLCEHFMARAIANGWTRPEHHNLGRPELCEIVSAAETLALARAAGARLHFVHMSAPDAVHMAARARDDGQRVTLETCPQYLLFTSEDMKRFGVWGKCHPPLRAPESAARLWDFVNDGTIDVIGTDHSPFPESGKAPHADNVWKAMAGHHGLETMLPSLLTLAHRGRLSLERIVALASENPARIFGLYPRKGAIQVGADADLVFVDLDAERVLDARTFFTKARDADRWYGGATVRGVPTMTLVRGTPVYADGQILAEPGHGTFVRPA